MSGARVINASKAGHNPHYINKSKPTQSLPHYNDKASYPQELKRSPHYVPRPQNSRNPNPMGTSMDLMPGEVRWNMAEANDLWHLAHRHAACVDRFETFRSMTMCKPFRLRIGKPNQPKKTRQPLPMKPILEEIVQTNFMPFLTMVQLWKMTLGIVPYFLEPIPGTLHYVPWVPVFGSGYVTTYFDYKTRKQRFRWWWTSRNPNGTGGPVCDETVGWIIDGKPPSLNGSIMSPLSSVLEDYRHYCYAVRDEQYASYHSTHPIAVLTHDSKADQAVKEHMIEGGMFSDAIAKDNMYEDLEAAQDIYAYEAESLKRALHEAGMVHDLTIANEAALQGPVMESESYARQYARETNSYYRKRVIIPPRFNVAASPTYRPVIDVVKWDAIVSDKICQVLGIPSETDKTSGSQKAVNKEGIKLNMGERLKRQIAWIEWVAEQVFLDIYGKTIQEGWNLQQALNEQEGTRHYANRRKRGRETLQDYATQAVLNVFTDVRVELHCTPLADDTTTLALYDRGFLTEDYILSHFEDRYGFPPSAMQHPKQGHGMDPQLVMQMRQQQFQHQMAEREMKLKERIQRDNLALKREQLKRQKKSSDTNEEKTLDTSDHDTSSSNTNVSTSSTSSSTPTRDTSNASKKRDAKSGEKK